VRVVMVMMFFFFYFFVVCITAGVFLLFIVATELDKRIVSFTANCMSSFARIFQQAKYFTTKNQ